MCRVSLRQCTCVVYDRASSSPVGHGHGWRGSLAVLRQLRQLQMRRWGSASPGRARRTPVGTDWTRCAGEQHPAQAYLSRRERSSPSRTRPRRAPALESTPAAPASPQVSAQAARATSLPVSGLLADRAKSPPASTDAPVVQVSAASVLPEVLAQAQARQNEVITIPPSAPDAPAEMEMGLAMDNSTPRRPSTSPARIGGVELAQRAALHDRNAYAAGAVIASSLAKSPHRSTQRDERARYRSPQRENRGYSSPFRQSPSPERLAGSRSSARPNSSTEALSLEPTTSVSSTIKSSWQPAHWAQNSAGDGPSAYRGMSPRSARQRSSLLSVRPSSPTWHGANVKSPAALHLDNLLRVPAPPSLLRAAASPREHEAAELFLSHTAVRHDGVPYDPYRAAKVMSSAYLRSPEQSAAALLATQDSRPLSSRLTAVQTVQMEHSTPGSNARYISRGTLSPVRTSSNAVAELYNLVPSGHEVSPQQLFRDSSFSSPQQSGTDTADKAVTEAFRRARSPLRGRTRPEGVKPAWEEAHVAALPPFRDIVHDDRLAAAERRHEKHSLALQAAIAPESWAQRRSSTTSSLQCTTQPRARSPSTRRPVQLRPSMLAVNADAMARAVLAGDIEAAARCLEAGTSPNEMPAGTQWSFLHSAAEMKHLRIVQLLLRAGANPLAVTRHGGDSPLHVVGDCAATVQALLDGGAQRGLRNFRGDTPIDMARAAGHSAALQVLESSAPVPEPEL